MDFWRRKHVTIQTPLQGRFYEFLDRTLDAAPWRTNNSAPLDWNHRQNGSPAASPALSIMRSMPMRPKDPPVPKARNWAEVGGLDWMMRRQTKRTAQSVGSTPSKSRDRTPPRFWDEGGALPWQCLDQVRIPIGLGPLGGFSVAQRRAVF